MSDTSHTVGTLSSVTWGVPTMTGYVVKAASISTKSGVNANVADENGCIVLRRYDDMTSELSLDVIINGATVPDTGTTITYNTVKYVVTDTDVKYSNKDYTSATIKAITSEHIALA